MPDRGEDYNRPALDRPTAYQPIGYALLDWTDEHGIDAVWSYLPRVPALVTWRLGPLLQQMAGGRVQLAGVRSEFRKLLESLQTAHQQPLDAD